MKTGVERDKTRGGERKMKTRQMIFMKLTQKEHICAVLEHNLSYLYSQYLLKILCSALELHFSRTTLF